MIRRKGTRDLAAVVLLLFCSASVFAQDRSAAIQALPPASRTAVVTENSWTQIPTLDVENGRIDVELGILRAAYRLAPAITPEATPEATVRTWLLQDGESFGIRMPNLLELVREKETAGARHLTFQQTLAGVKVYGRFFHVSLNQAGIPVMATSGYAPHLETIEAFHPTPTLQATEAASLARRTVSSRGATSNPAELFVLADNPPRLIWRTIVWPDSSAGEWEVLLDANTGELIQLMDQRVFSHNDPTPEVNGEGLIWIYDPLTASGQPYGGSYVDNNDQDNPTLNSLLQNVTLWDIELDATGLYRLNGPWVKITGPYAPAETDPSNFKYTRNHVNFEAVMVYHYIDDSQRYVQTLNLGHPPPSAAVSADPRAFPDDNSYYYPSRNALYFGTGGPDDAEDAGVILHEYGHVLMHHHIGFITPSFGEPGTLGEGFSDYWAVSYRRHLMEQGHVPMGDWRDVFPWDGTAWGGRRADGDDHYDTIKNSCRRECNIYEYGTTWSALMMDLWERIGRENADRLHLAGFSYLGPNLTLRDMVEALLLADKALHLGVYQSEIYDTFVPNGFLAAPEGVPSITHTPAHRYENLALPLEIEADILAQGFTITDANLVYRIDSGDFETQEMVQKRGSLWSAELQLPETSTLLEYYLQASTELVSRTLPMSAPLELWTVQLGPDSQAPTITFAPVTHISPDEDLSELLIQVTDNDAVSHVLLEYTRVFPWDGTTQQGQLTLQITADSMYSVDLPLVNRSGTLIPGQWMEYRLLAYDEADPPNIAAFPPLQMPQLRLDVVPSQDELGMWTPSQWPELGAGEWAADDSTFGVQGELWVTAPGISYSDQPSLSLLTFPEVNVAGYPNAQLEFWHWYDFEHSAVPGPGELGGKIHDGGQIQLSTDGGQSWIVATPEWGYNGEVVQSESNPLAGTPAFGGSSFGWRRVRVPLPDAAAEAYRFEVQSRLAFGTGSGNASSTTHNFSGWAVRDVRVLVDPIVEENAPTVHYGPAPHQFLSPGENPLHIEIAAMDDTGIESVRLHLFETSDTPPNALGTYRFRPSPTQSDWFQAAIPIPAFPSGGTLGYTIVIRDFDRNLHTLGAEPPGELFKWYVSSIPAQNALANEQLTGAWTLVDGRYLARTTAPHSMSSIVLAPTYFASPSERAMLRLRHAYHLNEGNLSRVSVTEDGGTSWNTLSVTNDYLKGATDFTGTSIQVVDSWFDLTPLRQPYQLRFDLVHANQNTKRDFWEIFSAEYYRLAGNPPTAPAPGDLALYPNYPNPFRGQTTISYVLPEAMHVQIQLFNLLGRKVQTITDRKYEAGGYAIQLNLETLAPGVYWVRMNVGTKVLQKPMTLLR